MGETTDARAELRCRLAEAARRPGMYGLQEDYGQARCFVMGCAVACPDLFDVLGPWAVARLGGARDKFGWWGALAVLAAARVAEGGYASSHAPHVEAFLTLVCEYLDDLADRGEDVIRAEYDAVLDTYRRRHGEAHDSSGVDVFDRDGWDAVCRAADESAVPALRHSPDPSKPWG